MEERIHRLRVVFSGMFSQRLSLVDVHKLAIFNEIFLYNPEDLFLFAAQQEC